MKEVDFSNFKPGNKGGNGGGISFLRFESGTNYKLRPFGKAVEFFKIFVGKGKPSIIVDPDDKDAAAKLLAEHSGTEYRPSYRNAMFVIDRADDKIKILEGGSQIFEAFGNWSAGSDTKPGSGNAGDWQIAVTGEGVGGSNPRKYSPVYLGPKMFTEDEKTMINDLKEAGKLKLANFLKETSLEKVVEVAFGVSSPAPAPKEPVASVASGDDSDMDW